MPVNTRALIVVIAISGITFLLSRPIVLNWCTSDEFARRRNVWFALTIAGFLLPNFWLFVLFASPVLFWAGRRDSNPIALYLLLMHVIPPLEVQIPVLGMGVNKLFALNMYRLLALTVLLPAALRLRRLRTQIPRGGSRGMEFFLLAYGALQVILFVPPDTPDAYLLHNSVTNSMRAGFLYLLDACLLYYVASRQCSNRKRLTDAMGAFCLSCLLLAPLAVFESLKHWALYNGLTASFGGDLMPQYNFRAGVLRAVVTAGHSLALGYLFAVSLGFWLYLRTRFDRMGPRLVVPVVLTLGLIFSYARGPWLGALLIYITYTLAGPRAHSQMFRALGVSSLIVAAIIASPLGNRVLEVLPYVGRAQSVNNIDYRERLAERSLQLIGEHPLLGNQHAYWELQDLRQGEGIIDFVNQYAYVAVFYGLLGLSLFLGFIMLALYKAYRAQKAVRAQDPDLALLGCSLVACITGTLIMIGTCSFIFGYAQMFYVLGGLAAAYVQIAHPSAERAEEITSSTGALA